MTYQYPNNYRAEEHLDEDPNVSCKYGFQTTQASKWLLIREFQLALKDASVIINDEHTLEELGTYIYIEDRSKTGAAQGLNDDCVMAMMLAYHGALFYPQAPLTKKEKLPSENSRQQRSLMDKFMKNVRRGEFERGTVI
jgi:hypothetical protein